MVVQIIPEVRTPCIRSWFRGVWNREVHCIISTLISSSRRRRSVQFHYASSECKRIRCPEPKEGVTEGRGKGVYFDCDPECQEQKFFYYAKGESLISGRDFGEGYI